MAKRFHQAVIVIIQVLISLLITLRSTDGETNPPLYYGWFFKDKIASALDNITANHLQKLQSEVQTFQSFLFNASTNASIENPLNYYTKPTDPNTGDYDPNYHVTAYYCGLQNCSAYTNKVNKYLGKDFKTEMVGIFFTPRTYGIRVKLSDLQTSMFDIIPSNKNSRKAHVKHDAMGIKETFEEEVGVHNTASKNAEYPGIDFIEQDEEDFHPTSNKAHVTIGCAPNVSAVTTGTDLLEILELESSPDHFCENITTSNGIFINMGKNCDIFVYYLKEKMVANASFEVYYQPSGTSSFSASGWNWVLIILLIKGALTWFNVQ